MDIRQAQLGDVEGLRVLYMEHLTPYPPAQPQDAIAWSQLLARLIDNPDYHLLVGESEGRLVSSVTLVVIPNLTHNLRSYAVIENVVTHAEARGRGCATALMARASEIAAEAGCYKIMLMTGSKRESTLAFYERCGFSRDEKTAFLKRL